MNTRSLHENLLAFTGNQNSIPTSATDITEYLDDAFGELVPNYPEASEVTESPVGDHRTEKHGNMELRVDFSNEDEEYPEWDLYMTFDDGLPGLAYQFDERYQSHEITARVAERIH